MPNILPAVEEVYVDITKGLYDQGLWPQTPEGGIYGPTTHDIYYYDITIEFLMRWYMQNILSNHWLPWSHSV